MSKLEELVDQLTQMVFLNEQDRQKEVKRLTTPTVEMDNLFHRLKQEWIKNPTKTFGRLLFSLLQEGSYYGDHLPDLLRYTVEDWKELIDFVQRKRI